VRLRRKTSESRGIIETIQDRLRLLADPKRAQGLQRFFKTGPGQYGAGDRFLGIRVPQLRKLSREYGNCSVENALALLRSPIHEERLLALLLLMRGFAEGPESTRRRIYDSYLSHSRYVNNWDLVDISAQHIIGAFLWDKDRSPLYPLAKSENLWERRIAIMATLFFIRQGRFEETLKISAMLLGDEEDLIHKAVGWMLREVGKRELRAEEDFLEKHYKKMPRTMLRYAIERFPEAKRRQYLQGEILARG